MFLIFCECMREMSLRLIDMAKIILTLYICCDYTFYDGFVFCHELGYMTASVCLCFRHAGSLELFQQVFR